MEETALLSGLRQQEPEALSALMERYTPYVLAICKSILRDLSPADAEEAAMDVFLSVWNHAGSIKGCSLKAYLGAAARNTALKRLRRAGRELPLEEDVLTLTAASPQKHLERQDVSDILWQTVQSLPQPDRELFIRKYYYCQSAADAARDLGLNAATVRTKLARGRKTLKSQLEQRGITCEDTHF